MKEAELSFMVDESLINSFYDRWKKSPLNWGFLVADEVRSVSAMLFPITSPSNEFSIVCEWEKHPRWD
jgi:hypothetical protein